MELENLDETALTELASGLASRLEPGDAVVLAGEIGTGKTTFVRAAARALGVSGRVTSPTYQLARSYEGKVDGRRVVVNHLDLYRLEEIADYDSLDFEEFLAPDEITFVEWAEPALEMIEAPTVISLSHQTPSTRRISISGPLAERMGN
ncbi:MAG: tRNA (adenosine(37)-N6)-threonylcarbamoyltransferase complex ATPase subunit type 1 TsaE [Rubrobacteraceae bacterium]